MSLWPLFLVSLAAVGYETALTRYFAVATWSEYGYWVISIVMVGFALSGVVLALWRDALARHGARLLAALPPLLVRQRRDRLPPHHDQSVQSAAIAEPGHLGRRSSGTSPATMRRCCRSSSSPACSSA